MWTNMSELDPALILAGSALLLGLIALFAVISLNRRLRAEKSRSEALEQNLERQLELVHQSISGLTAGAVGMDKRMQRLEAREKVLAERQETYEIQQVDDPPYGHAIRLVQQGAGIGRLVDELGLSESEAQLIARLHGQRDSA